MCLYYNTVAFKKQYPAIIFWRGLTHMRSMCVGVAETGANIVRPRRYLKKLFFFIVLLYDQKYQKSHKVVPALCILPASSRLALFKQPSPSGANIASEPSNRNLSAATGSKRSSADSDLLLCHVGLWRTSRVEVWVRVWVRT